MRKTLFTVFVAIGSLAAVPWLVFGHFGFGPQETSVASQSTVADSNLATVQASQSGTQPGALSKSVPGGGATSGLGGGGGNAGGLGGGIGGGLRGGGGSGGGGLIGGGRGGLAAGGMAGVGMGGGGMGGGGMGGVVNPFVAPDFQSWQRPNGPEPTWLENGRKSLAAIESLRQMLNNEVTQEIKIELLKDLPKALEPLNIQVEINGRSLEDSGLDLESLPASVSGKGAIRELLQRALKPHDLSYIVHESYIEITSKERAESNPVVRYYNLSFVLPDNRLQNSVIAAIQSSISPNAWLDAGGESTIVPIGPMLVIRTTEENHLEVEQLLSQLTQQLGAGAAAVNLPATPYLN